MPEIRQMLDTHPWPGHVDRDALAEFIEAASECGRICTSCADACLSEDGVGELRRCVRLNLDCADICTVTERVMTRQTEYDAPTSKAQVESCREVCRTCAEECERHVEHHEHCRVCAESCRRCEQACDRLLEAMK